MARVMLKEVVLGFAKDLFEATSIKGSKPKFRCTPMVEKGSENDKAILAAIRQVVVDKWGEKKADAILKQIAPIPQQYFYKDGDLTEYEGAEGRMLASMSNEDQPTLLTRTRAPAGKDLIYSGAICNISCDVYAYEFDGTKGVAAGVRGVQFVAHGQALAGGGIAKDDDFDDLGGVDDEAVDDFA
jgi:hypothetical protein